MFTGMCIAFIAYVALFIWLYFTPPFGGEFSYKVMVIFVGLGASIGYLITGSI